MKTPKEKWIDQIRLSAAQLRELSVSEESRHKMLNNILADIDKPALGREKRLSFAQISISVAAASVFIFVNIGICLYYRSHQFNDQENNNQENYIETVNLNLY